MAVLLWLAVCFIAACSMPGPQQVTPTHTYLLSAGEATGSPVTGGVKPCLSLRVTTPASAPGFGTRRMAYTTQAPRLDYFAFNEWVDTPARMVAALMETGLESSGLLGAVMTGSSDIRTDLRLDSEIRSLQQDFGASGSTLSLEIKVRLIEVSGRSLLDARTFRYREPVDQDGPEAGASAANRAAARFLTDLTQFIAGTIAGLDCPAGN